MGAPPGPGMYVLGRACPGDSRRHRRFAPLQHLDRSAGAGGAGGAGGAFAAAFAARPAGAQPALAGGDGAGPARLAAGDRGAAARAADGRPALPGQRADPAALARGDEAGRGARAARGVAVGAIIAGVAGVAWAAPERTTDHADTAAILLALALVAIPVALPYVLRGRGTAGGFLAVLSAGCGYAWTAIASKLLTDELAAGALLVGAAWIATAVASEVLALLSEMSALQARPATHVAPVMFAVQVLVPVLLAPLIFGESWGATPLGGAALVAFMALAVSGTVLLAGSRAVGAVIDSAHEPG